MVYKLLQIPSQSNIIHRIIHPHHQGILSDHLYEHPTCQPQVAATFYKQYKMRYSTLAATALLASTGLAAPSIKSRTVSVHVEFQGAADVAETQYVPADGTDYYVYADFSVSHIEVKDAPASVNCHAVGVDNGETFTYGPGVFDVGPPQELLSISCTLGPK